MSDVLNELYVVANMSFGIAAAILALLFLFLSVPKSEVLSNYRTCRKYMAAAYFLMAVFSELEFFMRANFENGGTDISLLFTLMNSSFQALLLPIALITLINADYLKRRLVRVELLVVSLFTIFMLATFLCKAPVLIQNIIFFFFIGYYLFQIGRGFWWIRSQSCLSEIRMNNFFSGQESKHLLWVKKTSYLLFLLGIMSLLLQVFPYAIFMVIFVFSYASFYTFFAIKYINYVYVFNLVAPVCAKEKEPIHTANSISFGDLEKEVNKWVESKKFTTSGITLNDLAIELKTNRTYLSLYVNTRKGANFNSWINCLRMKEAQSLLNQRPFMSVVAISDLVGYTDSSSFGKQFMKHTGCSPLAWRKLNTIAEKPMMSNGEYAWG